MVRYKQWNSEGDTGKCVWSALVCSPKTGHVKAEDTGRKGQTPVGFAGVKGDLVREVCNFPLRNAV